MRDLLNELTGLAVTYKMVLIVTNEVACRKFAGGLTDRRCVSW
jgi:hypothetical protein